MLTYPFSANGKYFFLPPQVDVICIRNGEDLDDNDEQTGVELSSFIVAKKKTMKKTQFTCTWEPENKKKITDKPDLLCYT